MISKKEQAMIDAKIRKLRIRAALCWSDDVKPDVPPPLCGDRLATGWLPTYWNGASRACSSAVHHGNGQADHTTSQGPRYLYSTKILALRARRYSIACEAAAQLAEIDAAIEEAEVNSPAAS
jgi:hypothetical protein